jgi:hypothetical protein
MNVAVPGFKYLLAAQMTVMAGLAPEAYGQTAKENEDKIEQVWNEEQKLRNKKLFNGSILALATIERRANHLILHSYPVSYKHYLAQRSGIDLGIRPLAVSGLAFYSENGSEMFLMGKRSEQVTQYRGYYEFIPSGSIDADHLTPGRPVDFKNQLMTELHEELGLTDNAILANDAFCLVFDSRDMVYDIGVRIEIDGSREFVINNSEYVALERLSTDRVSGFMRQQKIVETSRTLFEAWIELNAAGPH